MDAHEDTPRIQILSVSDIRSAGLAPAGIAPVELETSHAISQGCLTAALGGGLRNEVPDRAFFSFSIDLPGFGMANADFKCSSDLADGTDVALKDDFCIGVEQDTSPE